MSRGVRAPDYRRPAPADVPIEYCDGGVCWKTADRWEWSKAYDQWLAVCHEHGDRIKAHNKTCNGKGATNV